jgi:tyrosinase
MDPALAIPPNPRADGYGDNPRCHRRDVNNFFTSKYLTPAAVLTHITSNADILSFQDSLQGGAPGAMPGNIPTLAALHVGGHFSIWGDPGGDVYVSPNEPAFWLHHSGLDRHWWLWVMYQNKEVKKRTSMYEGKFRSRGEPILTARVRANKR